MSLPPKFLSGFPDEEPWNTWRKDLEQIHSLVQNAQDKARLPSDIENWNLAASPGPFGEYMSALHQEILRLREVEQANIASLSAIEGGLFRLNSNLKRLVQK